MVVEEEVVRVRTESWGSPGSGFRRLILGTGLAALVIVLGVLLFELLPLGSAPPSSTPRAEVRLVREIQVSLPPVLRGARAETEAGATARRGGPRGASLTVRVLDHGGSPVPGATASLSPEGASSPILLPASTDGLFDSADQALSLPAWLTVRADGYRTHTERVSDLPAQPLIVRLGEGWSIRGAVYLAEKRRIPQFPVFVAAVPTDSVARTEDYVLGITGSGSVPCVAVSADGRFEIVGLDPQRHYVIHAGGSGYCMAQPLGPLRAGADDVEIALSVLYATVLEVRDAGGGPLKTSPLVGVSGGWSAGATVPGHAWVDGGTRASAPWLALSLAGLPSNLLPRGEWSHGLIDRERVLALVAPVDQPQVLSKVRVHVAGYRPVVAQVPLARVQDGGRIHVWTLGLDEEPGARWGSLTVRIEDYAQSPHSDYPHALALPLQLRLFRHSADAAPDAGEHPLHVLVPRLSAEPQVISGVPLGDYDAWPGFYTDYYQARGITRPARVDMRSGDADVVVAAGGLGAFDARVEVPSDLAEIQTQEVVVSLFRKENNESEKFIGNLRLGRTARRLEGVRPGHYVLRPPQSPPDSSDSAYASEEFQVASGEMTTVVLGASW